MANIEMTNYEIHKQLFQKIDPPDRTKLKKLFSSVGAWFSTDIECNYYMLLCREKNDYTVFHFNNMNYDQGQQSVQRLLENRGTILDIIYVHGQDAYECWIKEKSSSEVYMYMLFPYNWGVIEIE